MFTGEFLVYETPFSETMRVVSLLVIVPVKSYNSFDTDLPDIFSQLPKMTWGKSAHDWLL